MIKININLANETFKMIEKILDDEEEERKLPILDSIYEAIEEILKRVNIGEKEKRYIYSKYDDCSEPTVKYARSVLDKIIDWIVENEKPIFLATNRKNIYITYK